MNVLFIAVDDLRPNLGCYGDPHAITPNIDRIAARGVVFDRAYCQQAVCNPSRASVMTGMRPDTLRVWDLQTHFRSTTPDAITLAEHFKNNGYRTECIGKIYHDPRTMRDRQSWSSEETLAFTNEVGGKYVLPENQPRDPEGRTWKAAAAEWADVEDDAYIDGQVATAAVNRLASIQEPFFLAVGFRRPHLPFSAPKKYWEMQDAASVALPPNPLPPTDVPEIALHNWIELRGYSDIPNVGDLTPDQTAHLRHGYYAATSYMDAQVGRVLDALEASGEADETVICLWGDHGWHLGEHGLWCKTTNFELDTRAPLIVSAPGHASGATTRSIVEFVDIYPTLTDLCNLPLPSGLEGTSLTPILEDPGTRVKDAAYSQFPHGDCMGCSVRTDRYRYTEWIDRTTAEVTARELYDHATDPLESANLVEAHDSRPIVARMADHLRENDWHVFSGSP